MIDSQKEIGMFGGMMFVIAWTICSWSCTSDDDFRRSQIYGTWQKTSQDTSQDLRFTQVIDFDIDHRYRIVWYYQEPENDEILGFAGAVSGNFTVLGKDVHLLDGVFRAAQGSSYAPLEDLQPSYEDNIYRFKYGVRIEEGGNKLTLISNPCNLELGFGCFVTERTFFRKLH
ncbi:hypothetical protein [Pleomorphovibrio marinus]|uniref:hypothetical protein n=1 Tax=Pleomorphovibrio marinus TaxID=2164132 RepID=UPI000E0C19E7|nr:hypothetical protein [Pleomorphovibrio marinus]